MTDNKITERLKADYGACTPVLRALNAITFSFRYDEESGGILGVDQGGFLMTREELNDLIEGCNKLFDFYGDGEIKRVNDDKQYNLLHPRRAEEKPEPKTYKPRHGWIYVVRGQGNQYKIGMTTREPSRRLAEWTPKLPFATELVMTQESNDVVALEASIHESLDQFRINGEWFELSPSELDWLKGLK